MESDAENTQAALDGTLASEIIVYRVPAAAREKLEAAGVRFGVDLRNAFDNYRFRPIPGVAAKTWEKVGEAMSDWMISRMAKPDVHESVHNPDESSAPAKPEEMPDPAKIDKPPWKPLQSPVIDVVQLFDGMPPTRLWATLGRRAGSVLGEPDWVIEGFCAIGAGSIRQERAFSPTEHASRSAAIGHLEHVIGDFLESASEVIDSIGEQHSKQVKAALVRLVDRPVEAVAS